MTATMTREEITQMRSELREEFEAIPFTTLSRMHQGDLLADVYGRLYRVGKVTRISVHLYMATLAGDEIGEKMVHKFCDEKLYEQLYRKISREYLDRYTAMHERYAATVMQALDNALGKVAAVRAHEKRVCMKKDADKSYKQMCCEMDEIDAKSMA